MNISSKINKLLKALEMKGHIYLINKEQFLSNETNKVCSVYKLFHLMPIEEYNKEYPEEKKNPNKYSHVKVKVDSSCDLVKILLNLVIIYKRVGETDG